MYSYSAGYGNAQGIYAHAESQGGSATGISVSASGAENWKNNSAINISSGNIVNRGATFNEPVIVMNVADQDILAPSATYLTCRLASFTGKAVVWLERSLEGESLYLRVTSAGGSNGSTLEVQTADMNTSILLLNDAPQDRLLHLIFAKDKWQVLSNIAVQ